MRVRKPLAAMAAVALGLSVPTGSQAQIWGVGGATEWTQLANHAQLVLEAARQAQAIKIQLQQWNQETIAGRILNVMEWGQFARDLATLERNTRVGGAVSAYLDKLDVVFRAAYPGYVIPGMPFQSQYAGWNKTNMATILTGLRTLNINAQQLQTENGTEQAARNLSQGAVGQMQAIQAGNLMADEQVQQLQKLRMLMMTQLQSELTWQGRAVNDQAAQEQIRAEEFGPVTFHATN